MAAAAAAAASADALGRELMEAVAQFDVTAVQSALARGADANYRRSGDEDSPYHQPTTPLRMVMFRISDCGLTDADLQKFGDISRILLEAGAEPAPAMEIAEARYGDYDSSAEPTPFQAVWTIVAQAAQAQQQQQAQ